MNIEIEALLGKTPKWIGRLNIVFSLTFFFLLIFLMFHVKTTNIVTVHGYLEVDNHNWIYHVVHNKANVGRLRKGFNAKIVTGKKEFSVTIMELHNDKIIFESSDINTQLIRDITWAEANIEIGRISLIALLIQNG